MATYDAYIETDDGRIRSAGKIEFPTATAQPLPLAGGTMSGNIILPTGVFLVVAAGAAPADAAVSANQAFLWFDPTNGAAALNVKAKQANGTVKTGTLAVTT